VEKLHISRSAPLYFLVLCLAASSAWGVDPSRRISQYGHSSWRIQDGAFSGEPSAITQTTDGYLWIATLAGLVRFDGVQFVAWTPPDGKHLPSSKVLSLMGGSDGSLWIGTAAGLARWKNGNLITYPDAAGYVNAIIEKRDGTVWTARSRTDQPLCQIFDSKAVCYAQADGIPFSIGNTLTEDSQGNLWIAGDTVLARWGLGSSSSAYSPPGLTGNGSNGILALSATPEGILWVGTGHSGPGLGLQQLTQGKWKTFLAHEFDSSTLDVSTLLLDRENTLWIGTTNHGMYRIRGPNVDHFRGADGLSSDSVNGFYEDREGNLWVATSKGIDIFRDVRVVNFSSSEGLSADVVNSVLASGDDAIWIGNQGALDSLRQGHVTSIKQNHGLPGAQVTSLFEDRAGELWVGIDDSLRIYKDGKFIPINKSDGKPVGTVTAITEDVDGNIWAEVVAPRRLIRIGDRKVREELDAPQVPAAFTLAPDPRGGVWLGLMRGGLARYRNGHLETFPFEPSRSGLAVWQIIVDPDGSVLGATPSGLIGWRNGKFQTLDVRNGLPCNNFYSLIWDDRGVLWLPSQCGLIAISGKELQKWWESSEAAVKVQLFDIFDGAQPSTPPFRPAASRSRDGRLWFANESVVQVIDPAHLAGNTVPPLVHVEYFVADRKRYSAAEGLRLPPLTRELEIDYTALSFMVPQKVRFRYKLEGQDLDWQEPGTRRQAFYNDLRPRTYRFRVIACNNDGVWNEVGASLYFSIAPAWYQTKWFRVLCGVSGLFVVWVLYRLRVRQIHKSLSARFDERMAERTRMARELHDTFLQTLQGSKLVAEDALEKSSDPVQMQRAMQQLSVWLDQAVQEGRAALNSLRTSTTQRNDLAEAFKRATEECRMLSPIEVSFSVTGESKEMHPVVRDEIYRVGYEAIRNACTHSKGSRLEVALKYGHDLAVLVRDNGIGIDPTVAEEGKNGHFGLQGMRERAARIGGKLTVASSADSGTQITVVVPGGIVFRKPSPSPLEKIRSILRRVGPTSHSD
jgi:signal transduction histidine kinase/ligand-binding sensor domain-containing protein